MKLTTCVEVEKQKLHQNDQSITRSNEDQLRVNKFTIDATILFGNS